MYISLQFKLQLEPNNKKKLFELIRKRFLEGLKSFQSEPSFESSLPLLTP